MKKCIYYVLAITLSLFNTACSTGRSGETVIGRPGSPMWFSSASIETQLAHFSQICLGYGFKSGTPEMSQCIQSEANNSKNRANSRMDAYERNNAIRSLSQPKSMTCTTFGNMTTCN